MARTTIILAALLLTGCGTSEPKLTPQAVDMLNKQADAITATPKCSDVWVVGNTLPKNYDGCIDNDGTMVAFAVWDCADGTQLTAHNDKFYARIGGTIKAGGQADDKAWAHELFDNCKPK